MSERPTRAGEYEPFAVSAGGTRHRVDRKTGRIFCGAIYGAAWYRTEVADHHQRMQPDAKRCVVCERAVG